MKSNIYLTAVILISSFLMVSTSKTADSLQPPESEWEHLLYLPDSQLLKILSFGNQKTMADYLWLKTTLYLGRYHDIYHKLEHGHEHEHAHDHSSHKHSEQDEFHFCDDKQLSDLLYSHKGKSYLIHLYPLLNTITDLDPHFIKPYTFAGYILPRQTGEVQLSLQLLKKGLQYNPKSWEIYFWQGFVLLFYEDDLDGALVSFKSAALQPGCPPHVISTLAMIYKARNKRQIGIEFLKVLLSKADNEKEKEQIIEAIQRLQQDQIHP